MIAAEHAERGITGIGEIGLDFSRPLLREKARAAGVTEEAVRDMQRRCFRAHLELAKTLCVPVNVHSRNAEGETLEILTRSSVHGVLHAYKGEVALAVEVARTGRLLFSFPPSIVYKREYQEAARALPLEVLLLETDSPSLGATGPKERNEPSKIGLAAAKIAELKCLAVEKVAAATTRNALRLFGPTAPTLVAMVVEPSAPLAGAGGPEKRPPRWRKTDAAKVGASEAAALGSDPYADPADDCFPPPPAAEDHMEASETLGAGDGPLERRRRWGGSRKRTDVLDPALCSSAFGSALRCD